MYSIEKRRVTGVFFIFFFLRVGYFFQKLKGV